MDSKADSHSKKNHDHANSTQEVGFVKSVRDFLIYVDGLPSVRVNDLIVSESGVTALVTALLAKEVEAWVLSPGQIRPGEVFKVGQNKLSVLVGPQLLGRAINPLGVIIDDMPSYKSGSSDLISKSQMMTLDREALGISSRQFITEQFVSGIAVLDLLVPLGMGQRELVIGDMRSGKTGFILDLIVNQSKTDTIIVYGMIGKSMAGVKNTIKVLDEKGGLKNCVVVAGFSTDPLPLIYLTAKTAMTVAEYFREQGRNVLLILDDMGSHAKVYREISLLGNRFPGREAYPGDIFHQHASLLERAGKFDDKVGGGSITALPVIELDLDDFSSFIPTNLMGMTDGHLLFKSNIYAQGKRPAVDVSMSVSRVGRQTQSNLQNSLSTKIKQTLAAAAQLSSVTGFGGELPSATQLLLRQKDTIEELLSQKAMETMTISEQIVLLCLPYTKFFSDKDINFVIGNKEKILTALRGHSEFSQIIKALEQIKNVNDLILKLDEMGTKLAEEIGEKSTTEEKVVDPQTWLPAI